MPTKLQVFNIALAMLGQPPMATEDATGEDGRWCRTNWDHAVELAHEKTGWDFAKVRVQCARQAAVPVHGYSYYYTIPSDCLRILYVSETENRGDELLSYEAEPGKIAASVETLYLTYVSETSIDAPGRWSASFARYVATELAVLCAPKLNPAQQEELARERKKALSDAVGLDATQGPPQRRRHGAWSSAARGFFLNRDREEQG